MRSFSLIATLSSLAALVAADTLVEANTSPAVFPPGVNPVSPPPSDISINKRDLCLFGICVGTGSSSSSQYQSDVNNCGAKYNVCPYNWLNGGGRQCVNGVCAAQYCNNLFDFNWLTGKCQDVSSDTGNCGKCGQTCSVDNATGSKCVSGQCYATGCQSGYSLASGVCTKTIDTTSDVNNCGAVNRKCPSSYSNGSGSICSNSVCQPKSCNSGFAFDYSSSKCIDVTSDSKNCGACNNVCQFGNGSGSCKNGQCTLTSCNSGYANLNGICTKVNTLTDVSNCGSVGNKCSYDHGVASCSNGQCSLASCESGYKLTTAYFLFWPTSTTCTAVDTSSDMDNCGSVGFQCPSTATNCGGISCQKGQCVGSCNYGYSWDSTSLSCKNVQNDVNNCGSLGNQCSVENGVATCSSGSCKVQSCNSGYASQNGKCVAVDTQTDTNNCGLIGLPCPASYKNGGVGICLFGKCQTVCDNLFDFDFTLGFCRDVSSDTQNCGKCGQKCSITGATATTCSKGQCKATACSAGYTLSNGACTKIDTTSDVNNCGAVGVPCQFSPNGATGICQNSKCVLTGCPSGYALKSGVCVKSTASQRARLAKKDKVLEPKRLCPGANEQACPILGSTSYAQAVEHHFNAEAEFSGVMLGSGGFECIDTAQALDSCGGCASLGEGQDCTAIRGAAGVGCDAGKCVVFSCESGWKPSLRGDKCVRVKGAAGRNSTAAARHLSGRHHLHHGVSGSHL
ncbi:hypothetical protein JCM8097_006734 [Rhodosporidiobolus ruineniae]